MKKKIFCSVLAVTLAFSNISGVFASTTQQYTKEVPVTLNGLPYASSEPVVFFNGKTYISEADLQRVTNSEVVSAEGSIKFTDKTGTAITYLPIRANIENLDGFVKWNAEDYSVDLYAPVYNSTNTDNVYIGTEVLLTTEPTPVIVDKLSTNLSLTSLTPVIKNNENENNDEFFASVQETLFEDTAKLNEKLTEIDFEVGADKEVVDSVSAYEYFNIYKGLVDQNGFLAIELDTYAFEGGANGIKGRRVVNIDFNNKEVLSLTNLFTEETTPEFLLEKINEAYAKLDDETVTAPTKLPAEDDFYFDFENQNLVVYYEPYEIAPGARGYVYLNLPLVDLKDNIKPEYKYDYKSNF